MKNSLICICLLYSALVNAGSDRDRERAAESRLAKIEEKRLANFNLSQARTADLNFIRMTALSTKHTLDRLKTTLNSATAQCEKNQFAGDGCKLALDTLLNEVAQQLWRLEALSQSESYTRAKATAGTTIPFEDFVQAQVRRLNDLNTRLAEMRQLATTASFNQKLQAYSKRKADQITNMRLSLNCEIDPHRINAQFKRLTFELEIKESKEDAYGISNAIFGLQRLKDERSNLIRQCKTVAAIDSELVNLDLTEHRRVLAKAFDRVCAELPQSETELKEACDNGLRTPELLASIEDRRKREEGQR